MRRTAYSLLFEQLGELAELLTEFNEPEDEADLDSFLKTIRAAQPALPRQDERPCPRSLSCAAH